MAGRPLRRPPLHGRSDEAFQIGRLASRERQPVRRHAGGAGTAVQLAQAGRDSILVRPFTEAEDIAGFTAARGILTSEGGKASHAALVARGMGRPCVAGASELRLAKAQAKTAPQNERLSEALTRNAWCSFTYNISGNRNMERLVFTRSGLVKQTPGKQAHWRVRNETLEFSPDGISWSPQPLRLALNASGSAVLQSHDKEYAQCD